jgi:predicted component of type VI protein secretion system
MPAKLIVTSEDPKTNQEFPFEKNRLTMGRKAGNDIQFGRPEMSGSHAAFLFEDGKYFVEDLGSTNGTFLNGGQLPPNRKYPLSSEDLVTIAPFQIKLVVLPDIMRTLMEPPQKDGGRRVSGTIVDRPEHLATGTSPHAEQFQPTIPSKSLPPSAPAQPQPAAAPAPKPAAAPAAAPAATVSSPPKPAAAAPEPPKPAPTTTAPPKPAPEPAPPAGLVPPQPPDAANEEAVPPTPATTKVGDYLWLAIGAICFLGAIGLILYLILGF